VTFILLFVVYYADNDSSYMQRVRPITIIFNIYN